MGSDVIPKNPHFNVSNLRHDFVLEDRPSNEKRLRFGFPSDILPPLPPTAFAPQESSVATLSMRHQNVSEMQTLSRGVYWARHTKSGCKLAYAVDSTGNEVKRLRVTLPSRESAAVETLWDLLDVVDPKPELKLVDDEPKPLAGPALAPRRGWSEAYDPYDPPPLIFRKRRD